MSTSSRQTTSPLDTSSSEQPVPRVLRMAIILIVAWIAILAIAWQVPAQSAVSGGYPGDRSTVGESWRAESIWNAESGRMEFACFLGEARVPCSREEVRP